MNSVFSSFNFGMLLAIHDLISDMHPSSHCMQVSFDPGLEGLKVIES